MDGVLTDFDKAVTAISGAEGLSDEATEEDKNEMYRKIEQAGEKFWADMEWKEDGPALWKVVHKFKPVLLSSPGYFRDAPSGKKRWVKKHLPGVPLFIEKDKYIYAEPEALLIDDSKDNIEAWEEAGGIGILHRSVPQTERNLIEIALMPGI